MDGKRWQETNPNDFNKSLEDKNKDNLYLIKPTIRLAKYWNARSAYVFDSFSFEKWIIGRIFWGCTNQKDYLFKVFDDLTVSYDWAQWRKDKVERAKQIVANVRYYENQGSSQTAEDEVKKLIP